MTDALSRRAGHSVLIVEDEFLIADVLATAVRASSLEVIGPAYSLGEAADLMKSADSAIMGAIVDINLRGEPAFPLLLELKVQEIPFVVTTGYDKRQFARHLEDVTCFQKPYEPALVVEKLLALMKLK